MLTNTSIQDQTVAIFFEWATSELRDRFDPKSPQLCVAPSSFETRSFTPSHTISIIPTDPIVRLNQRALLFLPALYFQSDIRLEVSMCGRFVKNPPKRVDKDVSDLSHPELSNS